MEVSLLLADFLRPDVTEVKHPLVTRAKDDFLSFLTFNPSPKLDYAPNLLATMKNRVEMTSHPCMNVHLLS